MALTVADLDNAARDLKTVSAVANSTDPDTSASIDSYVTREGDTAATLVGQLKKMGYLPPVTYAGGISFGALENTKTVEESGTIYAPKPSELPFTTSGTWGGGDESKFFVVQGATADNLPDFVAAEFADVANMKTGTALNFPNAIDWADYLGRKVSVVANNSASGKGGCSYEIVNVDPSNLSTLIGGIWTGVNHDLGGGFYAKHKTPEDVCLYELGAVDNSAYDATLAIQPYIDYYKNLDDGWRIRVPKSTFYLHTRLDWLNHGNKPTGIIEGVQPSRVNTKGSGSILYANTGGIGILIAGSENWALKGFTLICDPSSGTLTTPSEIGLFTARTATKNFNQFGALDDLFINITSNDQTINNNRGGVGWYNYASETIRGDNLAIQADTPMVFTTTNIDSQVYPDEFDNTGTETQFTTTNFEFGLLQLYPKTNSAIIMDIVRDFQVNTVLGYALTDLNKYFVEIYGDANDSNGNPIVTRRLNIQNIHTERLYRFARVGVGLLECQFQGKVGASISGGEIFRIANDGYMKFVECRMFSFATGTVQMINDGTTNTSEHVFMHHSHQTNSTDVSWQYTLGSAVYNDLNIYSDNSTSTMNSNIVSSLASNIIYLHGRDGTRPRGTYFSGNTSTRPTGGLYGGKTYFNTQAGENGMLEVYDSNGDWVLTGPDTATQAQLESVSSAINTDGKYTHKVCIDTTNRRMLLAAGSSTTSTWRNVADGTTVYTPS